MQRKNKKSQVTILIIIALIIVVVIALTFFLYREITRGFFIPEDPYTYIRGCISNSLEKADKTLLAGNGYVNITTNYMVYLGEKVPYLCKTSRFYMPCINQEPLLIEHYRIEMKRLTEKDIKKCFSDMEKNLKGQGYELRANSTFDYEIRFQAGEIVADTRYGFVAEKGDEKRQYYGFSGRIISPAYNLIDTARHIVNFESTLCNFDHLAWQSYYKNIAIKRFIASEGSKVYTLTDMRTNQTFKFAIKTCPLPAGI